MSLEKIGTGGCGFRLLLGDYIEEIVDKSYEYIGRY